MNLKSKKILAREFIILTIAFAIGILTFLLTFPYNSYKVSKEKKIASDILLKTHHLDSVNSSDQGINNIITINELPFKVLHEFDSVDGRHLSYNELKNLITNSKERESYYDEFNNKMKFKDFDEFEKILQTEESINEFKINKQQIDSIRTIKVTALQQDLDKLNNNRSIVSKSILKKQDQYQFSIWITIISVVLLILLRYVYYGISWSISTLRRKEIENY